MDLLVKSLYKAGGFGSIIELSSAKTVREGSNPKAYLESIMTAILQRFFGTGQSTFESKWKTLTIASMISA